jgi:hypothetical protein
MFAQTQPASRLGNCLECRPVTLRPFFWSIVSRARSRRHNNKSLTLFQRGRSLALPSPMAPDSKRIIAHKLDLWLPPRGTYLLLAKRRALFRRRHRPRGSATREEPLRRSPRWWPFGETRFTQAHRHGHLHTPIQMFLYLTAPAFCRFHQHGARRERCSRAG